MCVWGGESGKTDAGGWARDYFPSLITASKISMSVCVHMHVWSSSLLDYREVEVSQEIVLYPGSLQRATGTSVMEQPALVDPGG